MLAFQIRRDGEDGTVKPKATHNLSLEEMDRQSLIHPFTNLKDHASGASAGPSIIESGQGIRVRDQYGKEFIDAFAGLYCVHIGYGRTEVADAIHEQAIKLAYFHANAGHSNEPAIRLADRLVRMAPANMSKVFFGTSGSDANDTNIKLVWYYNHVLGRPEKRKIIARHLGYHGGTVLASGLSGIPSIHEAFGLPLGPILHTAAPHYYRYADPGMSEREFGRQCADQLDALIEAEGPDTVAAFIAEPVMGTGGIIPPPEGYWEDVQCVLDRHDVLLISDEIVCAFGRLGADFAAGVLPLKPDLITVAKGLTSGAVPLSASIIGEVVWKALEQGAERFGPFAHTFTYSAHPVAAAAALANLDIIEGEGLVANARDTGAFFLERLGAVFADHPLVGEVRGMAMLAALEFVADKDKKTPFDPVLGVGQRVSAACRDEGLIARAMPGGDILGFAPPLIMTAADADEVVKRTLRAVDRVAAGLRREI